MQTSNRQATPGNNDFGAALRQACIDKGDKIHTVPAKDDGVKVVAIEKPKAAKPVMKKQAVQKNVATAKPTKRVAVKSQPKPANKKPATKKVAVQPATNVSPLPFVLGGNDVEAMSHAEMQAEFARNEIAAEQAATTRTPVPHADSYPPSKLATKRPVAKAGGQETKQAPRIAKMEKREQKKAPAFPTHEVPIPAGRDYVIIFECNKKLILESDDLQIGTPSGGARAAPVDPAEQETVKRAYLQPARVDMVTFDRHCTISLGNVHAIPGSSLCRVFVNFKSAIDDSGKHWGEGTGYEKFLSRTLFGLKWNKVVIKDEAGKTSIILKKPDPDQRGAAELLLAFRE